MPEIILSDYFYGDESEEFVFFKIPRQLITNPKFKHVSTDAKLLYGMLLDRMSLSPGTAGTMTPGVSTSITLWTRYAEI